MNYDEFAFFNQQLASMLRDGIPLEGALLRLCAEMKRGALRSELELLAADLSKGVPLVQAIRARKLPQMYCQLLQVGAAGNDLPGVLTLLADHYRRRYVLWTRLKGLMVYPVIVLVCAFLLSCLIAVILHYLGEIKLFNTFWASGFPEPPTAFNFFFWIAPTILGLLVAAAVITLTVPLFKRLLRWRLPVFREASLSQLAAALSLLLKSGMPLADALALVEELERGTPAQRELAGWAEKLSSGRGRFSEMAKGGKTFPPLFVWMVGNSGEDLAAGFASAAKIYEARASYRSEVLLYSALPCAVMALGLMIVWQVVPVMLELVRVLNSIGE